MDYSAYLAASNVQFQSSTGDVGGRKYPGIAGGTWHDSFQSSTGDVGGRKRLRGATTGSASTFQSSTGDVGGRKPARRTSPHARVRVSILDRRRRRSQVLRNRTLELVTGVSILDRRRRRSQGVLGAAHDRAGRRVSILDRRRRRSQAAISWAGDLEIVVSILDRRRRRSQASLPKHQRVTGKQFQSSTGDVGGRKIVVTVMPGAFWGFNPRPATSAVASDNEVTMLRVLAVSILDRRRRRSQEGVESRLTHRAGFQSSTGDVGGRKRGDRALPADRRCFNPRPATSAVARQRGFGPAAIQTVSILDRRRRRSQGGAGSTSEELAATVSILDRRRRRSQARVHMS